MLKNSVQIVQRASKLKMNLTCTLRSLIVQRNLNVPIVIPIFALNTSYSVTLKLNMCRITPYWGSRQNKSAGIHQVQIRNYPNLKKQLLKLFDIKYLLLKVGQGGT